MTRWRCARSATAAYRAIPRHLLTSVAAGPWIRLYSFGSLVVLNAQLQAVVSLQSYAEVAEDARRRCSRGADAPRRRGDARALRLRLLELLRAAGRLVAARLPAVRRRAAEAPRAVRRALRRRRRRGLPRTPSSRRRSRSTTGSLGSLRFWLSKPATVTATTAAGRDQAPLALGRLALARLAGAEARGLLRGARRRRRLGGQPRRRSTRCRSCAPPRRLRSRRPPATLRPHALPVRRRSPSVRASPIPRQASAAPPRACGSFASASRGRPERLRPIPGSSPRCSGFRHGSGSSSTSPRRRRTTPGRAALAQYGASLVQQVPSIRDVLLDTRTDGRGGARPTLRRSPRSGMPSSRRASRSRSAR